MTIFLWNLYEKSFTPYHAQLAPKRYVHRHKMERQPSKVSKYFQDSKVKASMRFLKKYILMNTKCLILVAFFYDEAIKNTFIYLYKLKNHERSLNYAMTKEAEYIEERKRTHPDEFEEEEEEEVEVVAEEADDDE